MKYKKGQKVTKSRYDLEKLRVDTMAGGTMSRISMAKAHYEKELALKGEITLVEEREGFPDSPGLVVEWNDGTTSNCLDYKISITK